MSQKKQINRDLGGACTVNKKAEEIQLYTISLAYLVP